jgi:two-component system phosphate regulon response regulator OmpR
MKHILVVDDDERIKKLLLKYLSENGYIVSVAANIKQAEELLRYFIFDLIVLDLMLPGENGIDFTKRFRTNNIVPLLMLSALGEFENRVEGLEVGADDYLVKPFEPKELLLRIHKLIDRHSQNIIQSGYIYFGKKKYNKNTKSLLDENNKDIPITTTEKNILEIMIENNGMALSRAQLMTILGSQINERSVDVQIRRLRSKIETNPSSPIYLQTSRGEGYRLYFTPSPI